MAKKPKMMPAPKPEECGCEINTWVQFHLDMARRIVGQKTLAGDIMVQYLRYCIGRTYSMPTDEDAADILDSLIQHRKEAVKKHIANHENKTRAGRASGESRRGEKRTQDEQKGTPVQFCSTENEQKRTPLVNSNNTNIQPFNQSTFMNVNVNAPKGKEDMGKLTSAFLVELAKNGEAAIFDFENIVAVCRGVTDDATSDGCWKKNSKLLGEDDVRSTVRDCWAEWQRDGVPDGYTKGQILTRRLHDLREAKKTAKTSSRAPDRRVTIRGTNYVEGIAAGLGI